jgi:transaldolase
LEALKQMSKVVADTGELEQISLYHPIDATTNPSLILKAVGTPAYSNLLRDSIVTEGRGASPSAIADRLAVKIGVEVLKLVPGRVSTEVDARLSYNTRETIDKALHLMDLYSREGVSPERVYIKIASTWEGIRACEQLQQQGIDCNMTLLFSFAQAVSAADAGAALVSPFVGRILDWYRAKKGRDYAPAEDPGVLSVKRIYAYYKAFAFRTVCMAASFRNVGEIRELAGCDAITIGPALLKELEESTDPLPYGVWPQMGGNVDPRYSMDAGSKGAFDQMHGADMMAVEKLAEGVENFGQDQKKLETVIVGSMESQNLDY